MDTYPFAEDCDQADAAEAAARESAPTGPAMTHDAFMAALEDEDLAAG